MGGGLRRAGGNLLAASCLSDSLRRVTLTQEADVESVPEDEAQRLRRLHPAPAGETSASPAPTTGGSGAGPGDAAKVVDVLAASAEQEFNLAERLSAKARQAFGLAAGVFTVSQTVAFGGFQSSKLSGSETHWIIRLAIAAVLTLAAAAFATVKADALVDSRDLPLARLEDDLNAAYAGDADVLGRLGSYYLGVVRTRRTANDARRRWYRRARLFVALSLAATVAELVFSLAARMA